MEARGLINNDYFFDTVLYVLIEWEGVKMFNFRRKNMSKVNGTSNTQKDFKYLDEIFYTEEDGRVKSGLFLFKREEPNGYKYYFLRKCFDFNEADKSHFFIETSKIIDLESAQYVFFSVYVVSRSPDAVYKTKSEADNDLGEL